MARVLIVIEDMGDHVEVYADYDADSRDDSTDAQLLASELMDYVNKLLRCEHE